MTYFKAFLPLLALLLVSVAWAQPVRTLRPTIGEKNDYSPAEQLLWQEVVRKYEAVRSIDSAYEKLSEKDKALMDSLEMGYGPLTQGPECSWYCGGQMYKVTASSHLSGKGPINYRADNLHDFDLFTSWVPDTVQATIGQKINFHFKPLSARVNEITVYNGYIKNTELFKANARVKQFRLYINDVYYATLELADTTAAQSFAIPPIRSTDKKKDLVLTLEITAVYKGSKYTEVA